MSTIDVRVPDIGDFKEVPVVEVLVKAGDTIAKETPLVVLESEKASMEVPSSAEGTVAEVKVKPGDKVSEGSVLLTLQGGATESAPAAPAQSAPAAPAQSAPVAPVIPSAAEREARSEVEGQPQPSASQTIELKVPDIGDFTDVPVVDVLVKPGDNVAKEAPLVVLESEKASMEVPASAAGTIVDVKVKPGDKVSQGSVIATISSTVAPSAASATTDSSGPSTAALRASAQDDKLRASAQDDTPRASAQDDTPRASAQDDKPRASAQADKLRASAQGDTVAHDDTGVVHASPAIRRFARELGVDLHGVRGSGPHERVTREDVQRFVKDALKGGGAAPAAGTTFAGLPPWPRVDFAQYGEIERKPLGRIKKLSGPNLHRNWLQIPHITNQDEADITELEAFRNEVNAEQAKTKGPKLTMLAFLVKACVAALQRFPEFNASLDGEELVIKRYYNIGFAADTPNGLVVPVLKNADRKGLLEIAAESAALAGKAREGKLGLGDMQGGTFTISSIGGIGGTAFTQIVNAPEVAILGAVRSATKPVWDGKAFVPRLMLPISVSYDHRVIDGAGAARFLTYVASLLADFRRVAL
ncbi:MAG: dihydrolipoyllysine-residue acetyltransferase [Candidatus Eremiobacteraeota bacterium]|nr:dihydrolipoyllysine-residue acetyltransferase [Candidatus Eremiobacteraeota bacterium]